MDAAQILDEFAQRSRRYLWTDAFAVTTWVGLHEDTGEPRFLALARRLVDDVHETLGVSKSAEHPTSRGLRIGKPLPERQPHEPYDAELEWERDGQYFHYLTKWSHALQRVGAATQDGRYRRWAAELMQAAHRAFCYPPEAPRHMYWKMSIDLSRPLVPSMGAHDPLDGLVEAASLGLERELRDFERLCAGRRWATDDALGAGGLLVDALRLARLGRLGSAIVEDMQASVAAAARSIGGPASRRLAFRELGFALGLHAIDPLGEYADLTRIKPFMPLAGELEQFWLRPESQAAPAWSEHHDINAVMLAASLVHDV
jgi:hypothetical protein